MPSDLNGILAAAYDDTNKALRVSSSGAVAPPTRSRAALQNFWSALQNRNQIPVDILFGPGTSITAGTGANGPFARWQSRLTHMLRRRYPTNEVYGSSFGYMPAALQYNGPTLAGTPLPANVNYGLGNRASQLINNTQSLVWGTFVATKLTVYGYATGPADSITVSLGGNNTVITPGVVGHFAVDITQARQLTGVVTITWNAGTPIVEGMMAYDGDELAGIRAWDNSKGGSRTGDWLVAQGGSEDWLARIGSGAASAVTPALVILEQAANDYTTISSAQYAGNLTSIITKILANAPNTSILVLGAYRRTTGGIEPWVNYSEQARSIAAAHETCCYLDLDAAIDIAFGTGFLNDTYHPNNSGHELIAGLVFEYLTPPGSGTGTMRTTAPFTAWNRQEVLGASVRVFGAATADVTFKVVPPAGPTVDIVEICDAAGNVLLAVDKTGNVLSNKYVAQSDPNGSAAAGSTIDAAAGQLRDLSFTTNVAGVRTPRWTIRCNAAAESGANAGSDLSIIARDDTGATLLTPVAINRAAGVIVIGDTCNLSVSTGTGTKIGTSSTQKLGFWGATPIVQPAGWSLPTGTLDRTSFDTAAATLEQVARHLAALITDLKNSGLIGT